MQGQRRSRGRRREVDSKDSLLAGDERMETGGESPGQGRGYEVQWIRGCGVPRREGGSEAPGGERVWRWFVQGGA